MLPALSLFLCFIFFPLLYYSLASIPLCPPCLHILLISDHLILLSYIYPSTLLSFSVSYHPLPSRTSPCSTQPLSATSTLSSFCFYRFLSLPLLFTKDQCRPTHHAAISILFFPLPTFFCTDVVLPIILPRSDL